MLFKVKSDARYTSYTACGGLEFTKAAPTAVSENMVEEARACEFLEEVSEEPAKMVMPEAEKEELKAVVVEEAEAEEEDKPKAKGKPVKKEG